MSQVDMETWACVAREAPGAEKSGSTPAAVDLAEQLVLYAQARPELRCYVLIDPTLRDCRQQMCDRLSALGSSKRLSSAVVRLAPGRLGESHWPLLVELELSEFVDSELLRVTCEVAMQDWRLDSQRQGNGYRVGGWLFSAAPVDRLVAHLSAICIRSRTSRQRTLIRFYDPSVFELAWDDMDSRQRQALLGPVRSWHALRRNGRLTLHATEAGLRRESGVGEGGGPPSLGEKLWARLDQIGPFNRAWLRFAQMDGRPGPETVRDVRQALQRAGEYGFRDPDDLAEFAWRALSVSPKFDEHCRIQACIRAGNPEIDSFGYLTADLTEADWEVIGMESEKETGG